MKANLVLLCLLTGCQAGAPNTDCVGAVTNVLELADAKVNDRTDQIKNALFTQCADKRWSPAAADCLQRAQSRDDVDGCTREHLTGVQADAFIAVARPLLDNMEKGPLAKMEEFTDQMCACTDAQCAKDVSDMMVKWSAGMATKFDRAQKLSDAQVKHASDIGTRMAECMTKAMQMDAHSIR